MGLWVVGDYQNLFENVLCNCLKFSASSSKLVKRDKPIAFVCFSVSAEKVEDLQRLLHRVTPIDLTHHELIELVQCHCSVCYDGIYGAHVCSVALLLFGLKTKRHHGKIQFPLVDCATTVSIKKSEYLNDPLPLCG